MQKLIFIVDDNDANLTLAASSLDTEFRVLTMPSAKKMFEVIEKKLPDLILLDVEMPEMDGFEALAKLKENPQWNAIPVLFITGYNDKNLKSDAIKAGALDVFNKPIISTALLECVKKYLP
ncbi:MAG: response regulator [Treponema sp.]|nr:response regulator [Treponema sp.]MCL2250726.1 response regulator [Treponema sp.]